MVYGLKTLWAGPGLLHRRGVLASRKFKDPGLGEA